MNVLKALCLAVFILGIAAGCGSQGNLTENGSIDQVSGQKRFINVYGRDSIYPGEITSYYVRLGSSFSGQSDKMPQAQNIEWNVTGPFRVIQIRGLTIILQSENTTAAGAGSITVALHEPISGYQYQGVKKVRVQKY